MPMRFVEVSFVFFCLIIVHEFHRYDAQRKSTTEDKPFKPTSTPSPEEGLDEFQKLPESKKEKELDDILGSCNEMLKSIHEKEYTDFLVDCSANYTRKIKFLEETYMTQEYIEAHEDVKMIREILIEEKFNQVYLNSNSSFSTLVTKYNTMNADQQKTERTAFENVMRPMYHKSRQFQWQLFVRWLLETSSWSEDSVTSVRLKQFFDALHEFIHQKASKPEDFVRCVLTDWDDATRQSVKWPIFDNTHAYEEFTAMRRIFESIMKLRIGWISDDEEAYAPTDKETINLADYCALVLQNILLTRKKIEFTPGQESVIDKKRYCDDAVPDEVHEWNADKAGRKARKGKV